MIDNKEMYKRRSFQNDVKWTLRSAECGMVSWAWKGSEFREYWSLVSFHGCPGLTLHGQYQESCTTMVDRHGRPPSICFAIRPAKGQDLGGPFCPHYADLASLSSASLSDVGIPWTQKLEKHKDADRLLSPLPAFPLFRKCIVTNSGNKMEQGRPRMDLLLFLLTKQTNPLKNPTTSSEIHICITIHPKATRSERSLPRSSWRKLKEPRRVLSSAEELRVVDRALGIHWIWSGRGGVVENQHETREETTHL